MGTQKLTLRETAQQSKTVESVMKEAVQWIEDWFEANGPNSPAVIGISGGKDSTVAAALCVEALGNDRVLGVIMPDKRMADYQVAEKVCDFLLIDFVTVDIHDTVKSVRKNANRALRSSKIIDKATQQAKTNLPARSRMVTLYYISQCVNGRVVNTCNLSEEYIGYSTRWGDDCGDFAPLRNLTSSEVVAIGDFMGLPEQLTHKIPSDGLCGLTDEQNIGFSYWDLNTYIVTGKWNGTEDEYHRMINMNEKNEFKRKLIPAFVPSANLRSKLDELYTGNLE